MMKQRRRMLSMVELKKYELWGYVKYVNGRIITNATVNLTGTDFKGDAVKLTTKSDYKGIYRFELLQGTYKVNASLFTSPTYTVVINSSSPDSIKQTVVTGE